MAANYVIELFQETPPQWGLRGDPFLWAEYKVKLKNVHMPSTIQEFKSLLMLTFKELTKQDVTPGKNFFVSRYSKGGMSSGMVCCNFWIERAFPILIKRFSDQLKI